MHKKINSICSKHLSFIFYYALSYPSSRPSVRIHARTTYTNHQQRSTNISRHLKRRYRRLQRKNWKIYWKTWTMQNAQIRRWQYLCNITWNKVRNSPHIKFHPIWRKQKMIQNQFLQISRFWNSRKNLQPSSRQITKKFPNYQDLKLWSNDGSLCHQQLTHKLPPRLLT